MATTSQFEESNEIENIDSIESIDNISIESFGVISEHSVVTNKVSAPPKDQDKTPNEEHPHESLFVNSKELLIFSLVCIMLATFVMIGYYTLFDKEKPKDTLKLENEQSLLESNTTAPRQCLYLEAIGDGYCNDEANTPECLYDSKDCCNYENDFSQCQNCTCITEQEDDKKVG